MSIKINNKLNNCIEIVNELTKPVDELLHSGKLSEKDAKHLESQFKLISRIINLTYYNDRLFKQFTNGILNIFIKGWTTETESSKFPFFGFNDKKQRVVFKYDTDNAIEQITIEHFNLKNCFLMPKPKTTNEQKEQKEELKQPRFKKPNEPKEQKKVEEPKEPKEQKESVPKRRFGQRAKQQKSDN